MPKTKIFVITDGELNHRTHCALLAEHGVKTKINPLNANQITNFPHGVINLIENNKKFGLVYVGEKFPKNIIEMAKNRGLPIGTIDEKNKIAQYNIKNARNTIQAMPLRR